MILENHASDVLAKESVTSGFAANSRSRRPFLA